MTPSRELPELCQGLLDREQLSALVADLTELTQVQEVLLKGGEFSMAERSHMNLEIALEYLVRGQLRGVQVRYSWNGSHWMDTLLRSPEGIRLVRMPAPDLPESAQG